MQTQNNSITSIGNGISEGSIHKNWKTYKNDSYGISFKYPADWEILSSTGVSDPMPFIFTKLYFIKKINNNNYYLPSRFAIELIKNYDAPAGAETFNSYVRDKHKYFFEYYEKPEESFVEVGSSMLGDKKALSANIAGMFWDSYSAVWISEDRAIFIGSLGFSNSPEMYNEKGDPFEEIGPAPYRNNETIDKILASFIIEK